MKHGNKTSEGDTVALPEDCTVSTEKPYPIDVAITLNLATFDLAIASYDDPDVTFLLVVSKNLTVLNGTIIGGLTVAGGTVTVSGGEIGVKEPISITKNALITISGSTKAVEFTSKPTCPCIVPLK